MTRQEYLAREQEAQELRAQALAAYRDSLTADCNHGPRVRIVTQSGGRFSAGLACPAGNANCGIKWLSEAAVYRQWKDGDRQPGLSPA